MQAVIDAFESRVEELESYLRFLKKLDSTNARLCVISKRTRMEKVQPDDLKLLKASAFLLIYNVVEASVRDGFAAIYESIKKDGFTYQQVTQEMQTIWVQKAFDELAIAGSGSKTYSKLARELITKVIEGAVLSIDKRDIRVSGNVDAQKIRELCWFHGVSYRAHHRSFGGAELKTVKDHRNDLAHGSMSFSECGRMYTVEDLDRITRQVVIYLRSILRNIKSFIDGRRYGSVAMGASTAI